MEAWEVEVLLRPSYEAFEVALVDAADWVLCNVSMPNSGKGEGHTMSAEEQSYFVR